MNEGISLIVCCYNSSRVLDKTIECICKMNIRKDIDFEVIVVDNNSSDGTSKVVRQLLDKHNCPFQSKILFEPIQGLSKARRTGIENSAYDYIIFCDDDNWLNDDYAELSFRIMKENERIGAAGGENEAVTDGNFPDWFKEYEKHYSAGKQSEEVGNITWKKGTVWGAGMVVRKTALLDLFTKGYKPLLVDRKGKALSSGGDTELCYALRLAGWEIWYDPRLHLKHFISKERLQWRYLRKLNQGFGSQKVDFDAYLRVFESANGEKPNSYKWQTQVLKLLKKMRGYGFKKLLKYNNLLEGDSQILSIEKTLGRLKELMKVRGKYYHRIESVRNASWRKILTQGETNHL